MQHLDINFGGIWRFKLGFSLSGFFCLRNLHWFWKVHWLHWLWAWSVVSCFRSRNLKVGLQLSSVIRQLLIATRVDYSGIPDCLMVGVCRESKKNSEDRSINSRHWRAGRKTASNCCRHTGFWRRPEL